MAQFISDNVLDQGIQFLLLNSKKLIACAGQPLNYADATNAAQNYLGDAKLTNTDKAISPSSSGRKLIFFAGVEITIFYAGFFDHLAIINDQLGFEELLSVVNIINSYSVVAGEFTVTNQFEINAQLL